MNFEYLSIRQHQTEAIMHFPEFVYICLAHYSSASSHVFRKEKINKQCALTIRCFRLFKVTTLKATHSSVAWKLHTTFRASRCLSDSPLHRESHLSSLFPRASLVSPKHCGFGILPVSRKPLPSRARSRSRLPLYMNDTVTRWIHLPSYKLSTLGIHTIQKWIVDRWNTDHKTVNGENVYLSPATNLS